MPTCAGIHEIAVTATDVYVRTTGLGSHIMGPWYLNAAKTNLFPNYPDNQSVTYRLPLDPGTPPTTKTLTGLGRIGLFVDGVSMFDSRDAFSYDTSAGADEEPNNANVGDDIWNRDAFVNESITFDAGNAHQAGSNYHYHANPPALRQQLGDSVDFDLIAKNTALGGGFGGATTGGGNEEIVYIELPNPSVPPVPLLINNNNAAVEPITITIGGQPATFESGTLPDGNPASRVNASDASDRYWVKAIIDPVAAGLTTGSHSIVVEFRTTPQTNEDRIYTALNTFTVN